MPNRNDTEAARARKRRWQSRHYDPLKVAARRVLRTAIERNEVVAPAACQRCGDSPRRRDGVRAVQAHHHDYRKPLDVIWLCSRCHAVEHPREKVRKIVYPAVGSLWKQRDSRVDRTVRVVAVNEDLQKVGIVTVGRTSLTWAKVERFGRGGGYDALRGEVKS